MKQYTSRSLKTVALLYLAFPVVDLFATVLLFDISSEGILHIVLSPFFWIISVLACVSGYGLWEMRRWAWYVFLVANVLTVYGNALIVFSHGHSSHKLIGFLFSVIVIVGLIFRVAKEVRVPYFLPKIRWWESDPRYKLVAPVRLSRLGADTLEGDILDLSMGGCFVKLRHDLLADEPVRVQLKIFGVDLELVGIAVWRTQSTVTHPKGVGVKFAPLVKAQRAALRAVTTRLREIANLHRSGRYLMSAEDFHLKLVELQTAELAIRGLPSEPEIKVKARASG